MRAMKSNLICGALLALTATLAGAAQDTPTTGCMNELVFEPRLKPIADKVDLVRANPAVKAPDRVATTEEKAALGLWAEMRQGCFEYGTAYRRATSKPQEVAFQRSVFVFQQRLVTELQQGRVTYAEFTRRRAELVEAAGQEI
jgi:hypothetical protein